jgi:hypothetical protein
MLTSTLLALLGILFYFLLALIAEVVDELIILKAGKVCSE